MRGDLIIQATDKTGEDRHPTEICALHLALNGVLERYGFSVYLMGPSASVRQSLAEQQARHDREDLAEMLASWRENRDAEESE